MSEATPGTLLIWGAGAIGGTIGATLARAGHDVLLVDTDAEHVAAMQAGGGRPLARDNLRELAQAPE